MTNPIIKVEDMSVSFDQFPLLENASLQILPKERICLIGRNGAGKSTLLKSISGEIDLHSGSIWKNPGVVITKLSQDLPEDRNITVFDYVAEGLLDIGKLLQQYNALANDGQGQAWVEKLDRLQAEIEAKDGWLYQQRIDAILDSMSLFPNVKLYKLSGGWKRRAALARALVAKPDLLLLDEPTNHLDIAAITWLENELLNYNGALLFITHDRKLMDSLATRIIELDRGIVSSWPGSYSVYLKGKEKLLLDEQKQNELFDKKLAKEEVWIRQGIKARRTRNQGRVRALEKLREVRKQRRESVDKPSFTINEGASSGKILIEAKDINYGVSTKSLVKNFSLQVNRGDRIALVGGNGVGKSTLLKILLEKLQPISGKLKYGTNLQIAYFDQLRDSIKPEESLIDNLGFGSDFITIGNKQKHVISYLEDFLFSPQRARVAAKKLSGGETNRLLLAKLFSRESNLLVLDEPTNDLDIESLELLEELLSNYKGTVLIVSHDREFIDNIATSMLFFHGEGKIEEFFGGYTDWLEYKARVAANTVVKSKKVNQPKNNGSTSSKNKASTKLSYKEKFELDNITKEIEALELRKTEIQTQLSDPNFYNSSEDNIARVNKELNELEVTLAKLLSRWEELESRI